MLRIVHEKHERH